jgi:hypothetical protein
MLVRYGHTHKTIRFEQFQGEPEVCRHFCASFESGNKEAPDPRGPGLCEVMKSGLA